MKPNLRNYRLLADFWRGHGPEKTQINCGIENLAGDLSENPKIIAKVPVSKENEHIEANQKMSFTFFFLQIFQIWPYFGDHMTKNSELSLLDIG